MFMNIEQKIKGYSVEYCTVLKCGTRVEIKIDTILVPGFSKQNTIDNFKKHFKDVFHVDFNPKKIKIKSVIEDKDFDLQKYILQEIEKKPMKD